MSLHYCCGYHQKAIKNLVWSDVIVCQETGQLGHWGYKLTKVTIFLGLKSGIMHLSLSFEEKFGVLRGLHCFSVRACGANMRPSSDSLCVENGYNILPKIVTCNNAYSMCIFFNLRILKTARQVNLVAMVTIYSSRKLINMD